MLANCWLSIKEQPWFDLCHNTIAANLEEASLARVLREIEEMLAECTPQLSAVQHSILAASLQLIKPIIISKDQNNKIASTTYEAISESLNLPIGMLQDIEALMVDGKPRKSINSYSIFAILLPNNQTNGILADLTIEAIANGSGTFYQTPLVYNVVAYDNEFQEGLDHALEFVKRQHNFTDHKIDLRWTLSLPQEFYWRNNTFTAPLIEGGSAGIAFGLLVDQVMSLIVKHNAIDEHFLRGITATAILDTAPKFSLQKIGGVSQKVIAARHRHVGLTPIHTTVIAQANTEPHINPQHALKIDERDFIIETQCSDLNAGLIYKEHSSEFRIVVADDLSNAIRLVTDIYQCPKEIAELKFYLKPSSYAARIHELSRSQFTGREWLFKTIDDWLENESSGTFLLTGEPGIGKSTFAATLANSNSHRIISAIFCEYNIRAHSNPTQIIRTLAFQIATKIPSYRKALLSLEVLDALDAMDASTLFNYLIINPLLKEEANNQPDSIIIIDALDETTANNRNELAEIIAKQIQQLPAWIRIFITSRPETLILQTCYGRSSIKNYKFNVDSEDNRTDISQYVTMTLATYLNKHNISALPIDKILARSEGSFLYIEHFCCDVIAGYIDLYAPERFPVGLYGIFFDFFRRQFPNLDTNWNRTHIALSIILAAYEPLAIDVLQNILPFSKQNRSVTEIIDALGTLFLCTKLNNIEVIRPYHRSLAEWLTGIDDAPRHEYLVDINQGHTLLAATGWKMFQADPSQLASYFLHYLPQHLHTLGRDQDMHQLVTTPPYLDALGEHFDPGTTREIIRFDLDINLDADQVTNVLETGRCYFNASKIDRKVFASFSDNLSHKEHRLARSIAKAIDDKPVRAWLLIEGLAKALDNHLPEETDNWHQELVALSRNSLGPLISPLCAPALARIAIAGKHWYEIPCKWCDEKVIYHVA
ncbi:hypothetical protein TI05_12945, partial [Achromatium sp. WMS3]